MSDRDASVSLIHAVSVFVAQLDDLVDARRTLAEAQETGAATRQVASRVAVAATAVWDQTLRITPSLRAAFDYLGDDAAIVFGPLVPSLVRFTRVVPIVHAAHKDCARFDTPDSAQLLAHLMCDYTNACSVLRIAWHSQAVPSVRPT